MAVKKTVGAKKKKSPGDYGTNNRAEASVRCIVNPFINNDFGAKVPDGKSLLSVGIRQQARVTWTSSANDDTLLISPHFNAALRLTLNVANAGGTPVVTTVTPTTNLYSPLDMDEVSLIRGVSYGIKLMCTSGMANNDGWWEAVRYSTNGAQFDPSRMIDDPSYSAGKIRDISNYIFQLKPTKDHMDFQDKKNQLFENYQTECDTNFDSICIIFHGSAGVGIVGHSVANIEVQFDETSNYARFHSPSYFAQASLARAIRIVQTNVKAAKRVAY